MLPFSFSLRPPRHPLLRAVVALAGLLLLGFFAAFGVVIAAFVLLGFGLRRLLVQYRGGSRPTWMWGVPRSERNAPGRRLDPQAARRVDPQVIDGEFSVVSKPDAFHTRTGTSHVPVGRPRATLLPR